MSAWKCSGGGGAGAGARNRGGGIGGPGNVNMEKKIALLERRLILMERFVELRFCESFRDFSIRNLGSDHLSRDLPSTTIAGGDNGDGRSPGDLQDGITCGDEREDEETSLVVTPGGGHGGHGGSPATCSRPTTRSSGRRNAAIAAVHHQNMTPVKRLATSPPPPPTRSSARTRREVRVRIVPIEDIDEDDKTAGANGGDTEDGDNQIISEIEEGEIKLAPDSAEEDGLADQDDPGDEDHYFAFCGGQEEGEGDGDGDDDDYAMDDAEVMDPEDASWSDSEIKDKPVTRKRGRKSAAPGSKTRTPKKPKLKVSSSALKAENVNTGSTKECPICHKHWRTALFEKHVETDHVMERTLQCSFCDKRFFAKRMLLRHEKLHQPEKFGIKCRVGSCQFVKVDRSKLLVHERCCIRRALENDEHVDPEVIEDVRNRSQNVDLRWPKENGDGGEDGGKGKPRYCYVCRKSIPAHVDFDKHQESHKTWKCSFCENGKMFPTKWKLMRHLRSVHGKEDDDDADKAEEEVIDVDDGNQADDENIDVGRSTPGSAIGEDDNQPDGAI